MAMPPVRHSDELILDTARACILESGINASTLSDVARRCGVSRMTLYRRYTDMHSLVREVLEREFAELLRVQVAAADGDGSCPGRDALVRVTVGVVRAFQENALLTRVLETGPEVLVRYAIRRFGATQREALSLLSERLVRGHRDGSVRLGSVAVQAHAILLTAQSFVLSLSALRGAVPVDRLRAELTHMLDAYLRP
jgi:AcrR family transcriptional regulator